MDVKEAQNKQYKGTGRRAVHRRRRQCRREGAIGLKTTEEAMRQGYGIDGGMALKSIASKNYRKHQDISR